MELLTAIEQRRAIRQFEPAPVSGESLRKLIGAAIWAPSAMNRQPWHFAVVTDPLVLQSVEARAKAWLLEKDPDGIVGPELHAFLKDGTYHLLHRAPALIVIGAPGDEKWAVEDCAMAAQNMMLRATDLGLGTCWIGLVQEWLNTAEGLATVQFPPSVKVVAPLIIGKPAGRHGQVARRAPNIVWVGSPPNGFQEESDRPEASEHRPLYGVLIHP